MLNDDNIEKTGKKNNDFRFRQPLVTSLSF